MELKKYLNNLKAKTGDTYETIEEKSGISLSTIKNVFSGKTPNPQLDTTMAIFKALGGSLDDLMKEDLEIVSIKQQENNCDYLNRYIQSLEKDKRWFKGAACILLAVLLIVLCIGNFR